MKLLFVKEDLKWPRTSGHDVHTYYLMRSIQRLGHDVGLVTRQPCAPQALAGMELKRAFVLEKERRSPGQIQLSWLQERFRSYWGVAREDLEAVAAIADEFQPDALVAVGLDGLPYVAAARNTRAIWYAADEWFIHHLSLTKLREPATWHQLQPAGVKLLYERAFAKLVDRAWVVSDADRRSMRWLAGYGAVDVLPNGVDTEYFAQFSGSIRPQSCVFWGRLDFEPNIHALQWFLHQVWPLVRRQHPDAMCRVVGANPGQGVRDIAKAPGVEMHCDVPDVRTFIGDMGIAVMPFLSGGGIKNKILEAAAMAKPVICTNRALGGLRGAAPFAAVEGAAAWVRQLSTLWSDPLRCEQIGQAGREWVVQHHTWDATARNAVEALLE